MPTWNNGRIARMGWIAASLVTVYQTPAHTQQPTPARQPATIPAQRAPIARLVADPARVTLRAGEAVPFRIRAYDAQGKEIPNPALTYPIYAGRLQVTADSLRGMRPGKWTLMAAAQEGIVPAMVEVPVTVMWPAIARLAVMRKASTIYTGTSVDHEARGFHADSSERTEDLDVSWRSSNAGIASVDQYGTVTALHPGQVTISAQSEGVTEPVRYRVVANPTATIAIDIRDSVVRTGDVIHLHSRALRADGSVVPGVPIVWGYQYVPDDTIAATGGTGVIDHGLFTAERPGRYTLFANAGTTTARKVLKVTPRGVRRRVTAVGRGVLDYAASDFWPWTGQDGRDYALVGTFFGNGSAYVFDITDLSRPTIVDSINADARVVNDVMVSPDGRYGVMAREGASNRVNGVIILDLATPAHPKVAAVYSEGITGGVHNVFATNDYLYAISNGDKYVIIDMKDIYKPTYVGEYNHPNSRVHDLWVRDGIAYSSEWATGVVVVDVGNGIKGGTPQKPVLITTYKTVSDVTHEVYPYFQKSTGKIYLFLGDEQLSRQGRVWEGILGGPSNSFSRGAVQRATAGYTHIVDFTDPRNPVEIASYEVEEFGSHDIIVENDVLYQAYYEGGLRVVDVSGELLGNLARQAREIAVYKPWSAGARSPNAVMTMNAMPWKGHILFSDEYSGLLAVHLEQVRP